MGRGERRGPSSQHGPCRITVSGRAERPCSTGNAPCAVDTPLMDRVTVENPAPQADLPPKSPPPDQGEARQKQFMALFIRERPRLRTFTYSLIPVAEEAEDILQEVSLLLWKKFDEYEPDRCFYRWAAGFTYYCACNYRRSSARSRVLYSHELACVLIDQRVTRPRNEVDHMEALRQSMTDLTKRDLRLLAAIYEAGMNADEVAKRIGQQTGTVYNRLSAIRRKLLASINEKVSSQ